MSPFPEKAVTEGGKQPRAARSSLPGMSVAYAMGTFNDNFFKQSALLLAGLAGLGWIQGVAATLFALPFVLFSAWGGWFADRFSKRAVIIRSKYMELAAMLLGIAALSASGPVASWSLAYWSGMVTVVFLMGLQSTFFSPALNGSIPEQFAAAQVPQVNAWLKLVTTATILLGIALGGIILELPLPGGTDAPTGLLSSLIPKGELGFGRLAVASGGVCVSLIGIMAAHAIRKSARSLEGTSPKMEHAPFPWRGPLDSLLQAKALARKDMPLFLAVCGEAFFYGISSFAILIINNHGLALGFSLTVTSLLSVALMVGVCLGSLAAGRRDARIWQYTMIPAGAGMAIGLALSATAPVFPGSFQLPWLLTVYTATGICGGYYLIPLVSFIQIRPAPGEKGHILGISNFMSFSGVLLAGLLFSALSFMPPAALLIVSSLLAAVFLSWAARYLSRLPGRTLADTRGTWLSLLLRSIIRLRYSVETRGLDAIPVPEAGRPILFLPNHPALIDPAIVYSQLAGVWPRPLADERQMSGPLGSFAAFVIRAVRIPDMTKEQGSRARRALVAGMNAISDALSGGDCVLLYPSGRVYRENRENLRSNSGTTLILRKAPEARVVLVRTTGLWGSRFSYATPTGKTPMFFKELALGVLTVLANGIFFAPRRKVIMEFEEPADFPRAAERDELNRWLEAHYNKEEEQVVRVPHFFWKA
ncbi:MFS transporter [Desulfovibrio sp. OttesenSCG-928-I05]|nr:MFS transporter [Desulfovibrio sp. OttesenSCG-928-I05]